MREVVPHRVLRQWSISDSNRRAFKKNSNFNLAIFDLGSFRKFPESTQAIRHPNRIRRVATRSKQSLRGNNNREAHCPAGCNVHSIPAEQKAQPLPLVCYSLIRSFKSCLETKRRHNGMLAIT